MNLGARQSNLVRLGVLVAFIGFGVAGGWRSLERGAFQVGGRDSGTDATGELLLKIPDVSYQLRDKLRNVPVDYALLVYAPGGGWMADDLTRMAACLLTPRPVSRIGKPGMQPPAGQRPGAILFYQATAPAGIHAEALGEYAELAILK